VELRSAARVDTRVYAIGLDAGAPALEVARRGFSTMLTNRMSQLGRWDVDGARPTLRLADDVVVHLLEREGFPHPERVSIGIAAPAWFGVAERTHLADAVDAQSRYELVACSTPVAAAVGWGLVEPSPLGSCRLVVIDLRLGMSAAVVELGGHSVRERVSVGVAPTAPDADGPRRRADPDALQRALGVLLADASDAGCAEIDRVLVVSDERPGVEPPGVELERLLAGVGGAWAGRPRELLAGRGQVARGAAFVADPVGGRAAFGLPPIEVEPGTVVDAAPGSGGGDHRAVFVVEGVLARDVGVLLDDGEGSGSIHPVVVRGAARPSVHEQLFDLGPDDGSEVFLELFEAAGPVRSADPEDHRLVATARLRAAAQASGEVTVRFALGTDGRLAVEPSGVWDLDWVDGADAGIVTVRSSLGGSVASHAAPTPPAHLVEPPAAADPHALHARPEGERSGGRGVEIEAADLEAPDVEAAHVEAAHVGAAHVGAVAAWDGSSQPSATPPVAAALWRCERALSNEVGRLVTVRSLPALLGCADDAPDEVLLASARRWEQVLPAVRGALGPALREAIALVCDVVGSARRDRYFGGTLDDVLDELGRVVDHLLVVVGSVSPAEHRRLVLDAQLLGLSPEHARTALERLLPGGRGLVDAVEHANPPLGTPGPDGSVRWARYDAGTASWQLVPAPPGPAGDPSIRVLLDPP
jgi:hypothetical protein